MAVEAADVECVRSGADKWPPSDELLPLGSIEAVLAYMIAVARSEGTSEADTVEVLVRSRSRTGSSSARREDSARSRLHRSI